MRAFHMTDLLGSRINVEMAKEECRYRSTNYEDDEDENNNPYDSNREHEQSRRFQVSYSSGDNEDEDERTLYVFGANFSTRRGALRKFGERIGPV